MDPEYVELERPLTEPEREAALSEIGRWSEWHSDALAAMQRRAALLAYVKAVFVWIGLASFLFVAASVNEGASYPFFKAGAFAAACGVLVWLAARRWRDQSAAWISHEHDHRRRERDRWQAVLEGRASVVRVRTHRFAGVRPNTPEGVTYFFADVGVNGVFCLTSEHAHPCAEFEIARFWPGAAARFVAIGPHLEPEMSLSWSDFKSASENKSSVRMPFPEHGQRYAVPFDELTSLLSRMNPAADGRVVF